MNRRLFLILALICANALALSAQEKPAVPKAEKVDKPAEKSKALIFRPGAQLPEGISDPSLAKGLLGQKAASMNPMLDGPAQIVATFFTALREGKIDEGYATLTKGSKIAEKPEELRQLKTKTREAIEVFGSIHGFDYIESKAIGLRLVRATYVSLGKVFPLRWRFYFYKTDDVWRLIDMRVDDKLTGIFDEPEEAKPAEPAAQP
jgi:hypothetical protein